MIPGAIIGAALLELTLQALPLFVYVTGDVVTLQVLGTTFLLLVWLYLMANVIVFGAAYNFELSARTGLKQEHPEGTLTSRQRATNEAPDPGPAKGDDNPRQRV